MLILYLLSVIAREVILKMKSNVEFEDLNTIHDLNDVIIKYDNNIEAKSYIMEIEGLSNTLNSTLEVKDMLTGILELKDLPKEMDKIVESLKSKKIDLVEELKSGAYSFVIFFINSGEDLKKIKNLEINNSIKYFISKDENLAKKLNVSFPGILGFNGIEKNFVRLPLINNMNATLSAIMVNSFSKLSSISYPKLQQLEQPIYYIIDGKYNFEQIFEEIGDICKKFSSECKFLYFKPTEIITLVELLNVKLEDYPLMVYVSREKKNIVRGFNKDNFSENVLKMLNNQLENIKFASKIPEDNKIRGLQVLNTYTVEDLLYNESMDRLIIFTTSSCQYCMILKPEIELLGKELKKRNLNIICGDYNFIENEEIPGIVIDKVPLIYFGKKGFKEIKPIEENIRTAIDLISFLEKNASISIKAIDFPDIIGSKKEEENFNEKSVQEIEKETL